MDSFTKYAFLVALLFIIPMESFSQSCSNMVVNYKSGAKRDIPMEAVDNITFDNNAKEENENFYYTISFVGNPIKILSTEDDDVTEVDNLIMGYFNIVKVQDDLYYLYYIAVGENEVISNETYDLCMAYSTDGFNWKRGIPDGDGNVVMTGVIEQSVFMVPDEENPFRLIGNEGPGSLKMWKSKDGIHFTDKREILTDRWHDTQNVGLVKGDRIKVFNRLWNPTATNRQIGVAYVDLDGNLLTKNIKLAGDYLYNSAPIQIDERYEILLPTFFNNKDGKDDSCYLKAFVLDGFYLKEIDCGLNSKIDKSTGWVMVSPYMINIEGKNYIAYETNTKSHDSISAEKGIVNYYLIQVEINKDYYDINK